MFHVLDLFCGAGGLSLGFMQAEGYIIEAAAEKNPNAQATYLHNHPNVRMYDDVTRIDYNDEFFKGIDFVIGGPPCQGFSNANRQKNCIISLNNKLVKEFVRAIRAIRPKAFVMENVSMLKSDTHRFFVEEGDLADIEEFEIPISENNIILLQRSYNFEGLVDIGNNAALVEQYCWPSQTFKALNNILKKSSSQKREEYLASKRKEIERAIASIDYEQNDEHITNANNQIIQAVTGYYNEKIDINALVALLETPIHIQKFLSKMLEIHTQHVVYRLETNEQGDIVVRMISFSVLDYIQKVLGSQEYGYLLHPDVICAANYGVPQLRERFIMIGVHNDYLIEGQEVHAPVPQLTKDNYHTVKQAIEDLSNYAPGTDINDDNGVTLDHQDDPNDLLVQLRNNDGVVYNHIATKTRQNAQERFNVLSPGQNFHDLDNGLKENTYSNVERTQNTIYLKLNYDEPSPTVVNVRKSMWVHPDPDIHRAISIREAARLQSFPDSFVFVGSKDSQYQQVGNAVPPMMARAIATTMREIVVDDEENE